MKRNYLDLIFAFVGIYMIVMNVMEGKPTKEFFGGEINSWVYRGMWLVFTIVGFIRFFKGQKTN